MDPRDQIRAILYDDFEQAQRIAVEAVNLLRSGCPIVQVIVDAPEAKKEGDLKLMRETLSDAVEALSVFTNHEIPQIKVNEVFEVGSDDQTNQETGACGHRNYIFWVYKVSAKVKV